MTMNNGFIRRVHWNEYKDRVDARYFTGIVYDDTDWRWYLIDGIKRSKSNFFKDMLENHPEHEEAILSELLCGK